MILVGLQIVASNHLGIQRFNAKSSDISGCVVGDDCFGDLYTLFRVVSEGAWINVVYVKNPQSRSGRAYLREELINSSGIWLRELIISNSRRPICEQVCLITNTKCPDPFFI
nr:MAG: hypothetical protein AM324_02940 [Candidatus Thorarchaeota archaeon SMTZ1-83]